MSRREPTSSIAVAFEEGPSRHSPRLIQSGEDAALLESILSFYDQFAEQNDTNPSLQVEAAKAYRRIRDIQQRLGQAEKAEVVDRRALAILEKLVAEFPFVTSYRYELAKTYVTTTTRSAEAGLLEKTEQRLRRALEIQESLVAAVPRVSKYTVFLARTYAKLGGVLRQMSRTQGAETAYCQAVTHLKSLAGKAPTSSLYVFELSTVRQDLADLLLLRNQLAEACAVLTESTTDLEKLVNAGSRPQSAVLLLAAHYRKLGEVLARMGKTALAEAAGQKAKELSQNQPRPSGKLEYRPGPEVARNGFTPEKFSSVAEHRRFHGCREGAAGNWSARDGRNPGWGPIGPTRRLGFAQK
jgi:tetratricopeptide (TPR) repeat protein